MSYRTEEAARCFIYTIFLLNCLGSVAFDISVSLEDGENGYSDMKVFEVVDKEIPPFDTNYADNLNVTYRRHWQDLLYEVMDVVHRNRQRRYTISSFIHGVDTADVRGDYCRPFHDTASTSRGNSQLTLVVEKGDTAILPCHDCGSSRTDKFSSMLWIKIQSNPDAEGYYPVQEVFPDMNDDESENRVVITLDHTLKIMKATPSDAGSYLCHDVTWRDRILENKGMTWTDIQTTFFDSGSLRFIYHLDVLATDKGLIIEVSNDDESKRKPSTPFVIEEYNIQLVTEWQEWGPCSICGQEGERRRVGICFTRKLKDDQEVPHFPYLNNILDFSPSGIPCRSELLKAFQMGVLGLRPDEVERSTCFEPCRSRKKRQISSSDIRMNDIRKSNKVITVKAEVGQRVKLICLGKSVKANVDWVKGGIYRSSLVWSNETGGRLKIDMWGILQIFYTIRKDTGIYECWIEGQKRKVYDLYVRQNTEKIKTKEQNKYWILLLCCFAVDFVFFLAVVIFQHIHRRFQAPGKKKNKRKQNSSQQSGEETDALLKSENVKSSDERVFLNTEQIS